MLPRLKPLDLYFMSFTASTKAACILGVYCAARDNCLLHTGACVVSTALRLPEWLLSYCVVCHNFCRPLDVQSVGRVEACGTLVYVGLDRIGFVGQDWQGINLIHPGSSGLFTYEMPA